MIIKDAILIHKKLLSIKEWQNKNTIISTSLSTDIEVLADILSTVRNRPIGGISQYQFEQIPILMKRINDKVASIKRMGI